MSIEDYISKLTECKDDALKEECGISDNFSFLVKDNYGALIDGLKEKYRVCSIQNKTTTFENMQKTVYFTVSTFGEGAYTPDDEQIKIQKIKEYSFHICIHPTNHMKKKYYGDIAEETKEIISYLTANKIPFCMPRSFPRTKLPNGEYEFSKVVYWEPKAE